MRACRGETVQDTHLSSWVQERCEPSSVHTLPTITTRLYTEQGGTAYDGPYDTNDGEENSGAADGGRQDQDEGDASNDDQRKLIVFRTNETRCLNAQHELSEESKTNTLSTKSHA